MRGKCATGTKEHLSTNTKCGMGDPRGWVRVTDIWVGGTARYRPSEKEGNYDVKEARNAGYRRADCPQTNRRVVCKGIRREFYLPGSAVASEWGRDCLAEERSVGSKQGKYSSANQNVGSGGA